MKTPLTPLVGQSRSLRWPWEKAPGLAAIRLSVMARERDRWALGSTLPVEAGPVQGIGGRGVDLPRG